MYWTAAQLEPNRERIALHLLAQERFTVYAPRLRVRRTVRGRRELIERSSGRLCKRIYSLSYAAGWRQKSPPKASPTRQGRISHPCSPADVIQALIKGQRLSEASRFALGLARPQRLSIDAAD
jgi:hypothetical protein